MDRTLMKEIRQKPFPFSAEELEARLARGELPLLGAGSRRACYEIPGSGFCLKCYRDAAELSGAAKREIARFRHDARRNACCQEARCHAAFRRMLPDYVFAAFPAMLEPVHLPMRGWALVESLVRDADGGEPVRFSRAYRAAEKAERARLLRAFTLLVNAFAAYGVRFYDPQNVIVQRTAEGGFALRVVDFEPTSRAFVPVDLLLPSLARRKVLRRAERYLKGHLGVRLRLNGLAPALRRRWDALVHDVGGAHGLAACRAVLENKLVNDIFYEGTFRGEPCLVKCSSRAPSSLANECRMSRRLCAAEPGACAEALDHWASPDGQYAFVVLRRLPGPSLMDLIADRFGGDIALQERVAADMLRLARALLRAGIVWRDVMHDNFLLDESGHLRLIDAQFAVDRAAYREDAYMRWRWKYRRVVFAFHGSMRGRGWNDVGEMLFYLRHLEGTPAIRRVREELAALQASAAFAVPPTWAERLLARLLALRLSLQARFCRGEKRARILGRARRAAALFRDRPDDAVDPSADDYRRRWGL